MRTLEDVDPNMGFGVDANGMSLGGKPELAVLVARVIAAWATVESYVSLCSNALLAGQSNVAAAVYAVLSENALQYAALYAAADAALESRRCQALQKRTEEGARARTREA